MTWTERIPAAIEKATAELYEWECQLDQACLKSSWELAQRHGDDPAAIAVPALRDFVEKVEAL